jgi:hypothetical protein
MVQRGGMKVKESANIQLLNLGKRHERSHQCFCLHQQRASDEKHLKLNEANRMVKQGPESLRIIVSTWAVKLRESCLLGL